MSRRPSSAPLPAVTAAIQAVTAAAAGPAAATSATAAALTEVQIPAAGDAVLDRASHGGASPHPAMAEGPQRAVVLLPADLAGDHAETVVAAGAARLRRGGQLVVAAASRHGDPSSPVRAFDAAGLARLVGHSGLEIVDQLAPGAAARLAGLDEAHYDPDGDRTPGLLDAGTTTLCVGRRPFDPAGAGPAFFASLPRKVVAAAVVCIDSRNRLLCVHDTFKGHWTIPGGVVDADENPDDAARREAREEAGIDVRLGGLLGVFGSSWPDRLAFLFAAEPTDETAALEGPLHAHEIGAVKWLPVDDALERLAGYIADQVRCCLAQPGGVWREPLS